MYTKTLHYLEQSVAHWVISANVLVFMIPSIESEGLIKRSDMRLYHYAEALDGLHVGLRGRGHGAVSRGD